MYGKDNYSYSDIRIIDQLKCWHQIIGHYVKLGEKFCSPFRFDKHPQCYLREYNGVILFTDWAKTEYNKYTCLHAYAHLHNCNLHEAATKVINSGGMYLGLQENSFEKVDKDIKPSKTSITFKTKDWTDADLHYWQTTRNITVSQLEQDGVYSVDIFAINGKMNFPNSLCYAYTFPSGNVKLYQPYSKSMKWISNTNVNDIWSIGNSDNCVITKSYKDARQVHNLTGLQTYAFMNEIVIPEFDTWNHWRTFILYDNDITGIIGAYKLVEKFNRSLPKFVPKVYGKDIDEVVEKQGIIFSKNLLNDLIQ